MSTHWVVFVICGLAPSLLFAGPLPKQFTLGRYIPDNVWLYTHGIHNPERAWLDKEWQDVFDALKASGIDRDLTILILALVKDEDCAKTEATIERLTTLIREVRWGDLIAREVAMAERLAGVPVFPTYYLLARGNPASAEPNMMGLVGILKELAALSDKAQLEHRELHGVTVWSLTFGKSPFTLELLRKDDIIGLVTNAGGAEEVVALLSGKSDKRAIVATPRFREAMAAVKPPEDVVSFVDVKSFIGNLNHIMATAAATEGGQKDVRILSTLRALMELGDVLDYSVMTMETDGRRELTHQVVTVQHDKRKCALVRACLERRPFQRFDEFIPVDAAGFSISASIDLEQLYKLIIAFVESHIPDGVKHIDKWNEAMLSIGFDPQRDLFTWWSGEMIGVTLPPAVVKPLGGADWVWMFRVKDSELASQKVSAAIDFANGFLQKRGQMLMVSPAAVNAEGFRQVTLPLVMMYACPVVGVKNGWLMIGSSAAAINRCLDVGAGKAPSILKSERFTGEGLIPKGPVLSASFTDTSNLGEELAAGLGIAGMVGTGLVTVIPDEPKTRPLKQVVKKLVAMLMKLGPALKRIDFYSSSSSVTTYDGALMIRTEKVTTYKPAPPDDPASVPVK